MECHNQKTAFCGVCSKAFGSERMVQDHTRKVHEKWKQLPAAAGPPAACHLCNKHFSDMSGLQRHNRNIHKDLVEPTGQFFANCTKDTNERNPV
jgi:hypothetical protein